MNTGLTTEVTASIRQVLSSFPCVQEAILYGSRARGNYKNGSDIDLALKGTLSVAEVNDISLKLDDLYLPYTFDLSILQQIDNAALADHIHRIGVSFYKRA